MKLTTITVKEYSCFCNGGEDIENGKFLNGYYALKKSTFDLLERFALENTREGKDEALEIMGISARRGIGKIITVKNYVGVIALKDGTTIEILPKIYSDKDSEENARRLVVKMLNMLCNISSKNLQTANLNVDKMNILEAFIRMFVDEVTRLTKQGLKSGYETLEDNLTCFKGKIKFSQHIRHNFAHKERVYVAYDEFTLNRPENKILKSTLAYLLSHTRSPKTKRDIKNLLSLFDEVELSINYDADFSRIVLDRNTKAYSNALNWARVFLKKKSFTSFSGSTVSMALLFPMEKLFESYIPALMRRCLANTNAVISTQDTRYHLIEEPTKRFSLRPDIVLTANGKTYIMDTKWKRLSSDPSMHYGISQGDMYQMYAYHRRYTAHGNDVDSVTLIYPAMPSIKGNIVFCTDDKKTKIRIWFIDLYNAEKDNEEKSIKSLMNELGILT